MLQHSVWKRHVEDEQSVYGVIVQKNRSLPFHKFNEIVKKGGVKYTRTDPQDKAYSKCKLI